MPTFAKTTRKALRYTAVTCLKVLQAKAIPIFIPLLQDSDHDVRLAAIAAVAKLQVKEAIPTLAFF